MHPMKMFLLFAAAGFAATFAATPGKKRLAKTRRR